MSNTTPAMQMLRRKFRMGATLLDDVSPEWSPERVLAAYVPNYPYLQGATLSEPVVEGEFLVYSIVKPAAMTKGSKDLDRALQEIRGWGQRQVADPDSVKHWTPVLQKIQQRMRNNNGLDTRTPLIDPFLIPLA